LPLPWFGAGVETFGLLGEELESFFPQAGIKVRIVKNAKDKTLNLITPYKWNNSTPPAGTREQLRCHCIQG